MNQYLKQPIACNCARTHNVPISQIDMQMWQNNLAEKMQAVLGGTRALLLCDENTAAVLGDKVAQHLQDAGWTLSVRRYAVGNVPVVNDETVVGTAIFDAGTKIDGIIAVGGGTMTDLGRFIASRLKLPFALVMTCPSMDGYASNVAGMIIGGEKKVLKDCTYPNGIFCDLKVMEKAPMPLILSGFGDMLGKCTALPDWILAHHYNGDYYCQMIADLVEESSTACVQAAEDIIKRSPKAIATLTEALCLAGVTMALCEDTRPASGSEHIFSHYQVEGAVKRGEQPPSHGVSVAFGTLVSAYLYEYLLCVQNKCDISAASALLQEKVIRPNEVFQLLEKTGIGGCVDDHLPNKEALHSMIQSGASPKKRYTIVRFLSDHNLLEEAIIYVQNAMVMKGE